MFDFSVVTHWIDTLLRQWLPEWGALLIEFVLVGVVLLLLYAVIALVLIYAERKVCAFFQCQYRSESGRSLWNIPERCRYAQDSYQGVDRD